MGSAGHTSQVRLSDTVMRIDYTGTPGSVLVVDHANYLLTSFSRFVRPRLTVVHDANQLRLTFDQPVAAAIIRWTPTWAPHPDYVITVPTIFDHGWVIEASDSLCGSISISPAELIDSELEILAVSFDGTFTHWPEHPNLLPVNDVSVRELPPTPWRGWVPLILLCAGIALLRWPSMTAWSARSISATWK